MGGRIKSREEQLERTTDWARYEIRDLEAEIKRLKKKLRAKNIEVKTLSEQLEESRNINAYGGRSNY